MKKTQIIESARKLFTTYGYKKVSMNEIADNASVTKKTIYFYFKDKNELFKYFIKEEIENMKKIIETNEKKDLSFFEKIYQNIFDILKYRKNNKFIIQITKESIDFKNSLIIENLKLLDKSVQEYIQSKLRYAIENKYIRNCNVEISAFLIYKMYIALMYEWKDTELDEKELSDNIINILKNGLEYKEGLNT